MGLVHMYAMVVHLHAFGRKSGVERRKNIKDDKENDVALTSGRRESLLEEQDNSMPPVGPDTTENESGLNEDELNDTIAQLCRSKAEEFHLIGYEQVTGADVWECVSDKYHKKGIPPLHEIVNDILSLKVTQFMNYITLNMYRGEYRK
ncbi:hypothetical protein B1A99_15135 [Cohnella sp. CIP 111063]|nr:hypothetical protein B1A99_15135 [Cohnella sp. CIP 111063]